MTEKDPKQKLPGYYTKLDGYIKAENYTKIISTIKKILKITPKDEVANDIYGLALLQQGKYHEASMVVKDTLARSYCLYKQNLLKQAEKELKKVEKGSKEAIENLRAQIAYKKGEMEEATQLYEALVKNSENGGSIKTNLSATYIAANEYKKATKLVKGSTENSYGLTYNASVAYMELENYKKAEKLMDHAEEQCRTEAVEDGLEDEEIEAELAPLKTQRGYLYQLKGDLEKSREAYQAVIASKPVDGMSLAVASNNSLTVTEPKSLNKFEIEKRLKAATNARVLRQLSKTQRSGVQFNQMLFLLSKKKFDQVEKLAAELVKEEGMEVMIQAAIETSKQQHTKAIERLETFLKTHSSDPFYLKAVMTLAQLHISRGHSREAIAVCDRYLDETIKYQPSVVAAYISLMKKDPSNDEACIELFKKTIQHWQKENEQDKVSVVMGAFATFLIERESYELAQEMYQQMIEQDPSNQAHVAGFVLACSKFDTQKAENIRSQMVGGDALDGSSIALGEKLEKKYDAQLGSMSEADQMKTSLEMPKTDDLELARKKRALRRERRKKKKKNPRPKNFDPNYVPDPTRWESKKKKKKPSKNALENQSNRHQGVVANESLDRHKNPQKITPKNLGLKKRR